MPLPIFGAALWGVGPASAFILGDYALGRPLNYWGRSIDAQQTPRIRTTAYQANRTRPNVLPSPDAIISAFRRGFVDRHVARYTLTSQGVYYPLGLNPTQEERQDEVNYFARLWDRIGMLGMSRPDPAAITRAYFRKRLSPGDFVTNWTHLDADLQAYDRLVASEYNVPDLPLLRQMHALGRITDQQYRQGLAAIGWFDEDWRNVAIGATPMPGLFDLMRLFFLQRISAEEYAKYARAAGYPDDEIRGLVEQTYYQSPVVSDLIRFAVREVWDENVVQRWGYDQEFPEPFRFFLKAQGLDWALPFTGSDGRRYPGVSWPKAYWRSHWQVISPQQAYEAYHRLRPERVERYRQDFPDLQPFTLQDLQTALKIADYPKPIRDWLGASAYRVLRLIDIRGAYMQRIRDRQWAIDQLRDRGYAPPDAVDTVDLWDRMREQRERAYVDQWRRKTASKTVAEILEGYRDGFIDREIAQNRLSEVGIPRLDANPMLDLIDSEELRKALRASLKLLQREYLAGAMSDGEVLNYMGAMQVNATAANRYLTRWRAMLSMRRRAFTVSEVLRYVGKGLLSPQAGAVRLANLGMVAGDVAIAIADATRTAQSAAAKVVTAQSKAQQQQASQLVAVQKQAQQAIKQAQSALRALAPISTVKRWFLDGIVTEPWAVSRLGAMGYGHEEAALYLAEWKKEKADDEQKAQEKQAKETAKGRTETGGNPASGNT